jgi:hypothetical protein
MVQDTDTQADAGVDIVEDTASEMPVDAGADTDTDTDADTDTDIDTNTDIDFDTDTDVDVETDTSYCIDGDGDGYGEGDACTGPDCDDGNPDVYMTYEGYLDDDGDTYGSGALLTECLGATPPANRADNNLDCDDTNAAVNPGAEEIPGDGLNNDCDSSTKGVAAGRDPIDDDTGALHVVDFENGSLEGWMASFECELYGIDKLGYQELFPDGAEESYLYVSSGGNGIGGCSMALNINVPSGATTLEVKYNFLSQEYPEWVGSPYNDTFTVSLKGSPVYTVNRTVNNVASAEDWQAIVDTELAADIAQVGISQDASRNVVANGANKYDGKLKYGETTGRPADDNAGKIATMALPAGQTSVMLIVTVNDVADKIYDSVGVIDWIRIK